MSGKLFCLAQASDIDLAVKFRKDDGILFLIQADLSEANLIYKCDMINYGKIHRSRRKRYFFNERKRRGFREYK